MVLTSLGLPFGFPLVPGFQVVTALPFVVMRLSRSRVLSTGNSTDHATGDALRLQLRSATPVAEFVALAFKCTSLFGIGHIR